MADVGRGAVLYDLRPPERRRCCGLEYGRHLHHVTAVYEDVDTAQVLYEVSDGTHTTREYILGDDLLYDGMFEPAGWTCPVGTKPTYLLTRQYRVRDDHDLMQREARTDGGHLPSDQALVGEDRHLEIRFEERRCPECDREVQHRIETDHERDETETECSGCHAVRVGDEP